MTRVEMLDLLKRELDSFTDEDLAMLFERGCYDPHIQLHWKNSSVSAETMLRRLGPSRALMREDRLRRAKGGQ